MRFLIPKGRWAVLRRAALAVVVVVGCTAAATATAVLLQVKTFAGDLGHSKAIVSKEVSLPKPGAPQTFLLIGTDKRLSSGDPRGEKGNTDTMLLVRVNDSSQTINMLSIPRDLEVNLPGLGIQKLNEAYKVGGPNLLIKTIRQQVFPGFQVNQIMIASFLGFAHLINDIGCVYGEVDQRYYNHNDLLGDSTNFSNIDLTPGYQKLCGQAGGAKSALAFVRYRHTDNDEVRNARQQDFLRWAKGKFSTNYLLGHYQKLALEFGKNVQTLDDLHHTGDLANLFNVVFNADGHQVKSVTFPVTSYPVIGGQDYVASNSAAEAHAYRKFMTPTVKQTVTKKKKKKRRHHKHGFQLAGGMTADPADGKTQSSQLGDPGIPIYYPKDIPGAYSYCFTSTANCDEGFEPAAAYNNSYPRRYTVAGPGASRYKAWVMTLLYQANNPNFNALSTGQYFNVQGLQWKNPPLLKNPTKTEMVNGKKLLLYSQGGKLSTVAWRTDHAVYWIENTLENNIPNKQMIDMAATLTPYPSSLKYGTPKRKRHRAKQHHR